MHPSILPHYSSRHNCHAGRRYSPYGSVASLYLWAVSGGAIPELKDYKPKSKREVH